MTIRPATEGASAFDIGKLLSGTGLSPTTPGSATPRRALGRSPTSTATRASCATAATRSTSSRSTSTFLEVSYLLIYGELPTAGRSWPTSPSKISRHTLLHEDLKALLRRLPARRAPDAGAVVGGIGAVDLLPGRAGPASTRTQVELSTVRLLAKLPTIAAYAYKKSIGQPFLYPDNSLGLVENFLRMTFGFPAEPYEVDPESSRALDLLLILHADHEQNCSTSTVRLVGSSQANLFASVSAGINALFGPLHGGANQAVLEMLERIRATRRRRRRVRQAGEGQGDRARGSWASATASTRTTTRARRSSSERRRGAQALGVNRPAARHRQGAGGAARWPTTTSSSASSTRTSTSTPA